MTRSLTVHRRLVLGLLPLWVLLLAWPAGAQQGPETTRLAGPTRFETSAAIASRALQSAGGDPLIDIVQDAGWEMPLVVSSWTAASAAFNPPGALLLLPADGSFPPSSRAVAESVSSTAFFTVAGDQAFVQQVQTTLSDMTDGRTSGFGVVVEGLDDVESISASFAADVNDSSPTGPNHALLATTETFADALTAGPLAPTDGLLILTRPDRLNPALEQRLGAFHEITIVGGTAAVPQALEDQIRAAGVAVTRVSGSNRFLTAVAVADRLRAEDAGRFHGDDLGLARADVAADAIAAAPQAVADGSPILLTNTDALPADYTPSVISRLAGCGGITFVYGGTAAVQDTPVAQLATARCG